MTYVALLRGINVGGNNKVEMKNLKATFEALGFTSVVTYINSGNIIFNTSDKNDKEIVEKIEAAIAKNFGLAIKVVVKTFQAIETICHQIPAEWQNDKTMKTDVMFLWEEYDSPEVLEQLQLKPCDNVLYCSGAIIWNIQTSDYNQSSMPKLIGTRLYKHMTVRNVNTVRKLFELMKDN
ncbi:MAG: DUF1697 domain-containing protein [Flavobacteriaceae bacterium]